MAAQNFPSKKRTAVVRLEAVCRPTKTRCRIERFDYSYSKKRSLHLHASADLNKSSYNPPNQSQSRVKSTIKPHPRSNGMQEDGGDYITSPRSGCLIESAEEMQNLQTRATRLESLEDLSHPRRQRILRASIQPTRGQSRASACTFTNTTTQTFASAEEEGVDCPQTTAATWVTVPQKKCGTLADPTRLTRIDQSVDIWLRRQRTRSPSCPSGITIWSTKVTRISASSPPEAATQTAATKKNGG
jgi:hypothetical protein